MIGVRDRVTAVFGQDRGAETPMADGLLLEVEDVTVRFGGVIANNAVCLSAREGSITALLGPNGAGKTTLFNVISGEQRATAGKVVFAGNDVTTSPRHARARLGMSRTFQNLAVVSELTVLENVRIGAASFSRYGIGAAFLGLPSVRRSDRYTTDLAKQAVKAVGLDGQVSTLASALPYGDLRRLELARALCLNPRLLLLDEPAAGLDNQESQELVEALRMIRDHWNITIMLVEHDLELVRSLAEDAYVLDFGKILAGGPVHDVLNDPVVVEAYVGKPAEHIEQLDEEMAL